MRMRTPTKIPKTATATLSRRVIVRGNRTAKILASPEPSVFFGNLRAESRKKLEKPRCFWNNRGMYNASLLQLTEAFE
jgi:hypothetical protein